MKLTDICIKRPVLATVLNLLFILFGLIAFSRLEIRQYPNIDPPVVTVSTFYLGASSAVVESQVTNIIEDALAGISGIDYISSNSRPESSQITLFFNLNRDPEAATSDVRDRVSRIRQLLPEQVDSPVIQKVEADANPIIYLAFSSNQHNAMEITEYADLYIKDALQTLDGVAQVRIFGERRYAMRLWLDPMKMAAKKITVSDVETALRQQNLEIAAGRIESKAREFTLFSSTDLKTPEAFNRLILKKTPNTLVRLEDIGYTELGPEQARVRARFNGKTAIALGVIKQATANPLEVSTLVRKKLETIQLGLPEGMTIAMGHDSSVFIKSSLDNVYKTLFEAGFLVVLIIFVFLRSIRATLIPIMTIPISLMGAFGLMYIFNFTLNTLSLLALVLAIGLVVDDAIVMLENIYRHLELNKSPKQAALDGAREVAFAVISMTLTLAAVFLPIGFLTGATGKLFTEFAWSLAGAVLISGFVALTLSPMMGEKLLKQKNNDKTKDQKSFFSPVIQSYQSSLKKILDKPQFIFMVLLVIFLSSVFFYQSLNEELAPVEDQSTIVVIYIAPEGSTLDFTDQYAFQLEATYQAFPEVDRYFSITGFPVVSQGLAFVKLKSWEHREKKQQAIAGMMMPSLMNNAGVLAFSTNPPSLGQSFRSQPIEVILQTTGSYEALETLVQHYTKKIATIPGIINIDTDLKLHKPEIQIEVNRDKIADLGLSVKQVGLSLETLFGGKKITRFKRGSEQYEVMIQALPNLRDSPSDLFDVYLRNNNDQSIALSNVIDYRETVAPKTLNHFNQLRAASITANLLPGFAQGTILNNIENLIRQDLPENYQLDFAGQSREFFKAKANLLFMFVLALGFIYLVLSAQFESFLDPCIILLTVPLSVFGALYGLYLTGNTLSIYSQVGLITLIGLIAKHGILIVEFSNQCQAKGQSLKDAIETAARLRFRPILMTTAATIFGAIPLLFASGAGAESRHQMGIVIIFGLAFGTCFTLYVIPTLYYWAKKTFSEKS